VKKIYILLIVLLIVVIAVCIYLFCCNRNRTHSVTICSQVWMVKNLDVSKYRNGDDIPQVTDATTWANLTTGAWCYYENNTANGTVYGKLYNWFAVNDPRGLAPAGWHIPSQAEWVTLQNCLGNDPGGKVKETGTAHWKTPNTGATNSSGFTALPAGGRSNSNGIFFGLGEGTTWWTSSELDATRAKAPFVDYNSTYLATPGYNFKTTGYSVRCIKD